MSEGIFRGATVEIKRGPQQGKTGTVKSAARYEAMVEIDGHEWRCPISNLRPIHPPAAAEQ